MLSKLYQAKDYIFNIDFSAILNKMTKYDGWLKKDALDTCQLYRNFLFINRKYSNLSISSLPPSEDIDAFWHYHILDTKKYITDCIAIFGSTFHHYPYLGIDGKTNLNDLNIAFKMTQEIFHQEFGHYIQPTRSRFPKLLYAMLYKLENKNIIGTDMLL